ncbi:MAG: hypothetical protein ABFR53_02060 [Actinomycetota bacterium]
MNVLKVVLRVIGVVQLVLGAVLLVPGLFESVAGLDPAPEWVSWMFAMFAARSIGFGYGMLVAANNPEGNVAWIKAMIGVQAIDWIATIAYLATGAVTLSQVTTAVFLPLVFIFILARRLPRPVS